IQRRSLLEEGGEALNAVLERQSARAAARMAEARRDGCGRGVSRMRSLAEGRKVEQLMGIIINLIFIISKPSLFAMPCRRSQRHGCPACGLLVCLRARSRARYLLRRRTI